MTGSKRPKTSGLSPSTDLLLLREGRINLDEYMDRRVEKAMAPLSSLGDEERRLVREILRDELVTDPLLRAYLEKATGQVPDPSAGS